MSMKEKLKKIASENTSNWLAEAEDTLAHAGARRNARKVALRVLQLLREREMSQTELAEKMGVSRQQVTKIIKGKENFTFETIDKLEKALGITLITIASATLPTITQDRLLQTTVLIPADSYITRTVTKINSLQDIDCSLYLPNPLETEHADIPFIVRSDYRRTIQDLAASKDILGLFVLHPKRQFFTTGTAIAFSSPAEEFTISQQNNINYSMS
jgi:transcriptional regulator with XRE-family HTH domain